MKEFPTLSTARLNLRAFGPLDAPDVHRLAGDREVASTTLHIPHPYEHGMAEEWIATHREKFEKGEQVTFAIVRRDDDVLVGAIGLGINSRHACAEMGYWIGKPYWGNGYCTEAARAVLDYAFDTIGLNRVFASYFTRNPASGKIMQKIGMSYEGCRRQHIRKWEAFEDLATYGILKSDPRP